MSLSDDIWSDVIWSARGSLETTTIGKTHPTLGYPAFLTASLIDLKSSIENESMFYRDLEEQRLKKEIQMAKFKSQINNAKHSA